MGVRIAQAQNTGSSGRSPKTLSGSASRSRASCTWARPALKARSSPNGSKAPPSRDDQPSRSPARRALFSGIIPPYVERDRKGRHDASPWLSGPPDGCVEPGPEHRQPRATLPTPATAPDLTPPPHLPPMSAPAGETHRAGVCQTRHGVGPAPPITSPTSAIHPPGGSPCAAPARFLDPPPVTRSRARGWTSAGSSMTLDASLTVIRPCSTASCPARTAGLSSDSTLAA